MTYKYMMTIPLLTQQGPPQLISCKTTKLSVACQIVAMKVQATGQPCTLYSIDPQTNQVIGIIDPEVVSETLQSKIPKATNAKFLSYVKAMGLQKAA